MFRFNNLVQYIVIALFSGVVVAGVAQAQDVPIGRSDAPIEITADDLSVKRSNQVAVFSGDVEAVQADLTLRSDIMTVFYRTGATKVEGQNSISRIDVEGNVFLATPEETARGKSGVYDVDKKRITMIGNVVLTRQQNVVTGTKLVYEIDSGKSQLFSDKALQAETPQPGADGQKKQRVKALFVPEKDGDKQ